MAEKKKTETAEKSLKAENTMNIGESIDVEALIAQIKNEVRAEIKEEIAAEEKAKAAQQGETQGETEEQLAKSNELVEMYIPFVEGEAREVNITLNGRTTQIMRGKHVKVPRKIAEIWEHSQEQAIHVEDVKMGHAFTE